MIEIRSSVKTTINGDHCLYVSMTRNEVTMNCAMIFDEIDDGNAFLETIIPMIKELTHRLYPEMDDTLLVLKSRLIKLEKQIKEIEESRNQ